MALCLSDLLQYCICRVAAAGLEEVCPPVSVVHICIYVAHNRATEPSTKDVIERGNPSRAAFHHVSRPKPADDRKIQRGWEGVHYSM